jgi:hypothetical protein
MIMPTKIKIAAHDILRDIRKGVSYTEILKTYSLSERAFLWVCSELVKSGLLSVEDVPEEIVSGDTNSKTAHARSTDRYELTYKLPVYRAREPKLVGAVQDISEQGIRVSGIRAKVGQRVTLVIPKDEFGEFATLSFKATCRWLRKGMDGKPVLGFEIDHISVRDLEELRFLMKAFTKAAQKT